MSLQIWEAVAFDCHLCTPVIPDEMLCERPHHLGALYCTSHQIGVVLLAQFHTSRRPLEQKLQQHHGIGLQDPSTFWPLSGCVIVEQVTNNSMTPSMPQETPG